MFPQRILWAIDPFEEVAGLSDSQLKAVKAWAEHSGASVYPVHVFSARDFNLSVEFAPILADEYRPAAEHALKAFAARLDIANVQEPRVLTSESASQVHSVGRLMAEAHRIKADLIVVGTHGRKGVDRWLMGSFTETLSFRCDIPMMVVSSHSKMVGPPKKILFPTDLEDSSRDVFEQAVDIAKSWDAELVVYHAIPNPLEPVLQSAVFLLGGAWMPTRTYFSDEGDRRRALAESWTDWARTQGVHQARAWVEEANGQISELILNHSERNGVDLVLIGTKSRRLESFLIGSIARQVLRQSLAPVVMLHERKLLSRSAA